MSTIVDGKSGEIVTPDERSKIRCPISRAEKMKAAADMIKKFSDKTGSTEPAKPKPTGRKETIRGYEAEEYVVDRGALKASYWLAPKFPDGAAILRQLQAVESGSVELPPTLTKRIIRFSGSADSNGCRHGRNQDDHRTGFGEAGSFAGRDLRHSGRLPGGERTRDDAAGAIGAVAAPRLDRCDERSRVALLLASGSPRRASLLREAGYNLRSLGRISTSGLIGISLSARSLSGMPCAKEFRSRASIPRRSLSCGRHLGFVRR